VQLHEAMVCQAQAPARDDARFLDWCDAMIRTGVSATTDLGSVGKEGMN